MRAAQAAFSHRTTNVGALCGRAKSVPGAGLGNILPYAGYSSSNTLINALRPFPQFSTIGVLDSPTGKTWYDSLQMKFTRRLSHGLQGERHLHLVQIVRGDPASPFCPIEQIAAAYGLGVPLQHQHRLSPGTGHSAHFCSMDATCRLRLRPQPVQTTLAAARCSAWPGQPLYLKDLNCGCINPYTDVVLNPNAWANPVNGSFGPALGTLYADFRQARRPQENFNIARTFRLREGASLQIRAEFVNIFNRTQIGNPSTSAPGSAPST